MVERILKKEGLSGDFVSILKIFDATSCLDSLHYMHACGFVQSRKFRQVAKCLLRHYKVEPELLNKYMNFYVEQCSPCLKSSYILFPLFLARSPQWLVTLKRISQVVNWIERGIQTSSNVASVARNCCVCVMEQAVKLACVDQVLTQVFQQNKDFQVHSQWCMVLNTFSDKHRRMFVERLKNLAILSSELTLEENKLFPEHFSTSFDQNKKDTNNVVTSADLDESQEKDETDAASVFAHININAENANIHLTVAQEYAKIIFKNINHVLNNPCTATDHVFTMADVINNLNDNSDHKLFQLNSAPMPRRTIAYFYKIIQNFVNKSQVETEDVDCRKVMLIQLLTHSKKIIDFCTLRLKQCSWQKTTFETAELNKFILKCLLSDLSKFRPYAISNLLSVLNNHFHMNTAEVTKTFLLHALQNANFEILVRVDCILSELLMNCHLDTINFRDIYTLLLQHQQFRMHKTWKVVYDNLFMTTDEWVPLTYFKYRNLEVLHSVLAELFVAVRAEMTLMERIYRLHWALLLLERIRWMGPPGFTEDPWLISISKSIRNLIMEVPKKCPAFLILERFNRVFQECG